MKGSGTFIEDGLKEMILFLLCSPVESRMTGRDGSPVGLLLGERRGHRVSSSLATGDQLHVLLL